MEALVSMAILSILVVLMVSILNQSTTAWTSVRGKVEQFRQARDAFESMTRRISQSTLNTYWDYLDAAGNARTPAASNFVAARYARQSELRFISGPAIAGPAAGSPPRPTHSIFFLAPLGNVDDSNFSGMQNLLNTWGYYIEYKDDTDFRPDFISLPPKKRFRLMELMQPSESMTLYSYTSGNSVYNGREWFTDALTMSPPPVHVLAENVIALVLLPQLPQTEEAKLVADGDLNGQPGTNLSPNYFYDSTISRANPLINSKNQLPPVVRLTMVAIDEVSAGRMTDAENSALQAELADLFENASNYESDLSALETYLVDNSINYRVFTTNISIKGAKWSREQAN